MPSDPPAKTPRVMPLRQAVVDGHRIWIKTYPQSGRRRVSQAVLDTIARRLGLHALRPPPQCSGRDAKALEARRLRELRAQGVRVPEIVSEDDASLRITDLGSTMSTTLRAARDAAARDALTSSAIVDAHRKGAYFGRPVPRNMTIDDAGIGLIDFEEDSLEVMSLEQAQARDWLLFTLGIAKYYGDRPDVLASLLDDAFRAEPPDVGTHVHAVGQRLHGLARIAQRLDTSARAFAQSILVLRCVGER